MSPLSSRRGRRGLGRGGPSCLRLALLVTKGRSLSPALSPLVPRGEREKIRPRGVANSSAVGPSPGPISQLSTQPPFNSPSAFTLLEVMIACSIFFMVAFAIMSLVTGGLAQAKALQQRDPDAGVLAATLSLTNQLVEGVESGDFEDLCAGLYRDFRWTREVNEVSSNGLFQVDFIVTGNFGKRRGSESRMSVLMFRPGSKVGSRFGPAAAAGGP